MTTTVLALTALFLPVLLHATTYTQTDLTSSVPGLAAQTDTNLINPWGVAFSPTGPFWVSDQGSSLSTLYDGAGNRIPLVVTVPGGPTGQVFNTTTGFVLPNGSKASFLFDTLGGNIVGWNGAAKTTAVTVATTPGATYTGLALASTGGNNYLYAANAAGTIDVFNSSFARTTLTGNFTDPQLPGGYVPYNVQNIGGQLYVTYVKYDAMGNELPSGIVDVFNANGTFASRLSSSTALDAPWGLALAPSTFGSYGGDLLIGNFLNGEINAFDPISGAYLGTLDGSNGQPIVNDGLWSLNFRTAGTNVNTNSLYFTAGIDGETAGLFGAIAPTPTPEPAPFLLVALGGFAFAAIRLRPQQA